MEYTKERTPTGGRSGGVIGLAVGQPISTASTDGAQYVVVDSLGTNQLSGAPGVA